ncbi:MAG: glycine C-acetyltransferase [Marinoscillum sp.]|nr:glycine C-acetyltransferase [Marinoscillum sp.]OUX26090.1 MAG: glycine C-acetyltransferase [Flammeovirgaceae bacterium TMED262]|tara:strand:+ start:12985 stop:14172 length:1188 start_codon:yes stop_codon:yes gene_type:complete
MNKKFKDHLLKEIENTKKSGLFKNERIIKSPQSSLIETTEKKEIINLCSNNYLGLSSNPEVTKAAKDAIDSHGFGMSSVRFICGTQNIHKELENKISSFLGMEDTILYAAAFDANGGVFEPLFGPEDAIISDQLNHASIIDGIRLCKAQRHRYLHNDMNSLEEKLQETSECRTKIIVTDGVFSMDGTIAQLDKISDLAKKYDALVMSDECHSTGFIGEKGRGVHELKNVIGKIDIITGTLGKALGGASGGFTSSTKEVVEILRQKSRPYLFSNTLAPSIVGASLKVFDLIEKDKSLINKLKKNTQFFRNKMKELGFDIVEGNHPIVPIMLYDAKLAKKMSERLLEKGVYVIGFYFPVVPKDLARIRVQLSAGHTLDQLEKAIDAFKEVGEDLKII